MNYPELLYWQREYQPYFGFGGLVYVPSQRRMEQLGLIPAGYRFSEGVYSWEPSEEWQTHRIGDFLYEKIVPGNGTLGGAGLGLHHADEVESIEPSRRFFVLGGSLAAGSSARTAEATWAAVLEREWGETMPDLRPVVFNCAMGAFVALQELTALFLAIAPRKPAGVIFLNGFNDLETPWSHGTRPGDPFNISTILKCWYERPFVFGVQDARMEKALDTRAREILMDDRKRRILGQSIANVYCESMDRAIALCESIGAKVMVFFQPWRQKTQRLVGSADSQPDFPPLMAAELERTFELIRERMTATHPGAFRDLTSIFDTKEQLEWYVDAVHVDDRGHRVLGTSAARLLESEWFS